MERVKKAESAFFDALTGRLSLDDLTDIAYSFLENPVLVTNETGTVFSTAKSGRPYNDTDWEYFAINGKFPKETRSLMKMLYYARKIKNNEIFVFEHAHVSHRVMLFQTAVGPDFNVCVSILDSMRSFSKEDGQILRAFALSAALFIREARGIRNYKANAPEYFLQNSAQKRIDGGNDLNEMMQNLHLKGGDKLSLLTLKKTTVNPSQITLQEAQHKINGIFPKSASFIRDKNIALIINHREMPESLIIARARELMLRHSFYGCMSRIFDNFEQLYEHYKQSVKILESGPEISSAGTLLFADDMWVNYILGTIEREKLATLCYPPVLELLELEEKSGAGYMMALYAYALTFGSCSMSARLLDIHYNSMKSRLDQIAGVIGRDFESILPTLLISLKIIFLTRQDFMDRCYALHYKYKLLKEKDREQRRTDY
jgi:hypothetical protein